MLKVDFERNLTKFDVPIMQSMHEMNKKLNNVIIFLWVIRLFDGSVVGLNLMVGLLV
jgi:hypothetical protein